MEPILHILVPVTISAITSLFLDVWVKKHLRIPQDILENRRENTKIPRSYGIKNWAGMLCFCTLAFGLNNLFLILGNFLEGKIFSDSALPLWRLEFGLFLTLYSIIAFPIYYFCARVINKIDIMKVMKYPRFRIVCMNGCAILLAISSWCVLIAGSLIVFGGKHGS